MGGWRGPLRDQKKGRGPARMPSAVNIFFHTDPKENQIKAPINLKASYKPDRLEYWRVRACCGTLSQWLLPFWWAGAGILHQLAELNHSGLRW